jgi:hypothetical protein
MMLLLQLSSLLVPGLRGDVVANLTSGLVDLVSSLQSVSVLIDVLGNGFDVHFLLDNADTIDRILAGGGSLEKIVNRSQPLFTQLHSDVLHPRTCYSNQPGVCHSFYMFY